jgi:hypothetical protein
MRGDRQNKLHRSITNCGGKQIHKKQEHSDSEDPNIVENGFGADKPNSISQPLRSRLFGISRLKVNAIPFQRKSDKKPS